MKKKLHLIAKVKGSNRPEADVDPGALLAKRVQPTPRGDPSLGELASPDRNF